MGSLLSDTCLTKTDVHSERLRDSFLSHSEIHKNFIMVYTDGSKTDEEVRTSAFFPYFAISHTLPTNASVFVAERIAFTMALT